MNVSTAPPPPASVRDQVLQALDPDGRMQREMAAVRDLPPGRHRDELRWIARDHEAMINTVVRYWASLTDRGWGVANVGVHVIREAGRLLDQGAELAADEQMATWFDRQWMDRTIARVEFLVDGTTEGRQLFAHRARLLKAALDHHHRGEYAASIIIVLSQVEGITAHVTAPLDGTAGKLFFTKSAGRQADVVDASDLASIEASLAQLRNAYSAGVPVAQAAGDLSRHGIFHGQELAFDNEINSAKCWSLLDVLVQWALPRGRERDAKVSGQRGSAHAGSQKVDERGRRLDDREFKVTRSGLYEVCAKQSSYARRSQAFNASEASETIADEAMSKRGLPIPHRISVHATPDHRSFWAQRQTISGWWLAKGLTLNESGFIDVWYYSAAEAPATGPSADRELWGGVPNIAPPDWQGGD